MKMTKDEKIQQVNSEYEKCRKIIDKALLSCNYEKAMAAISVASNLLYNWNQRYTDDYLEETIESVAKATIAGDIADFQPNCNTILFYDGFGLDSRGLALIYLKALGKVGKDVCYVVSEKARNAQPEIDKVIANSNSRIKKIYYSSNRYYDKLKDLQRIVEKQMPGYAFLYTAPDDSAGIALFMQIRQTVRYQINLTDHAFWLGVHAFDYCLEFREYGANISANERGVDRDKLVLMPYYPSIDKSAKFQGWPFDVDGKKIIFSGGSLYKTIDKDGTYYQILSNILKSVQDCIFVYAGSGDDTYLNELIELYPNRVYFIAERTDLYQVMCHSTIYLNTYPFVGGLMMQYAVSAGKIPITLLHGSEQSGILIDQEKKQIEYSSAEELVADTIRLLDDPLYLKSRESLLSGSVISEEDFLSEIFNLIINNHTKYSINDYEVDTRVFRDEYIERFDMHSFLVSVAQKMNMSLLWEFRSAYLKRACGVFLRK